jgi:hypothetical protein
MFARPPTSVEKKGRPGSMHLSSHSGGKYKIGSRSRLICILSRITSAKRAGGVAQVISLASWKPRVEATVPPPKKLLMFQNLNCILFLFFFFPLLFYSFELCLKYEIVRQKEIAWCSIFLLAGGFKFRSEVLGVILK